MLQSLKIVSISFLYEGEKKIQILIIDSCCFLGTAVYRGLHTEQGGIATLTCVRVQKGTSNLAHEVTVTTGFLTFH